MINQKVNEKQMTNKERYPHWDKIRDSWVSNQSHCDKNSPSAREHYIEKGICFATEWLGDVGFLRYYLFHIDNNYQPGQSKLQRIDEDKGFNPQNCYIEHNPKNKNSDSKIRPDNSRAKDSKPKPKSKAKKSISPTNITNNFIIAGNNADEAIKSILKNYI